MSYSEKQPQVSPADVDLRSSMCMDGMEAYVTRAWRAPVEVQVDMASVEPAQYNAEVANGFAGFNNVAEPAPRDNLMIDPAAEALTFRQL